MQRHEASTRPGARGGGGAFAPPGGGASRSRLPRTSAGFTLIELIVVVAIIGILATIAVPAMRTYPQRARESALKEDLFTIRSTIDQFKADRGRYPNSLEELVSMGYLRSIPIDPVTKQKDWVTVPAEIDDQQDERDRDSSGGEGIIDVHSGSDATALDGSKYADW